MSLQASSGPAWRSLAALIILPRFSASSRSGMNSFMQASPAACVGPDGCGGGPKPAPPPPMTGAAPAEGNADTGAAPTAAEGAAPLTGGNAGSFGVTP